LIGKILHNAIINKAVFGVATVAVVGGLAGSAAVVAKQDPPNPNNVPTSKDQCKNGVYAQFGFRNQGQCVSFFEHTQHGYTQGED